MNKKNILAIDNKQRWLEQYKQYLEDTNYQLEIAKTLDQDAISSKINILAPSVILISSTIIKQNNKSDLTWLDRINIPIVILFRIFEDKNILQSILTRSNSKLISWYKKPFDKMELLEIVEDTIIKSKDRSQNQVVEVSKNFVKNKKVLIIEDDQEWLSLLSAPLEENNISVIKARNLSQAKQKLNEFEDSDFLAFILDTCLDENDSKNTDGVKLVIYIKKKLKYKTPVIIVSAFENNNEIDIPSNMVHYSFNKSKITYEKYISTFNKITQFTNNIT